MNVTCASCGGWNPPVNRFCGSCGAKLDTPMARVGGGEERRWASVLFADLSGFTAMSERMDPEDVKQIAAHCTGRMSEIVRRYGGTVVNLMGDAVLAVFGAPVAHEDDAERAVRAALEIRDCSLNEGASFEVPISAHVGVNTGEVMAGSVGPEGQRTWTVMGDTVNTGARLMSSAARGTVLVGEETERATRRAVRYRELAPLTMKGKQAPVRAWEALGAARQPGTRRIGGGALVGRRAELELLLGVWARVTREVKPQLVTVLGDPGIGKSRLTAEFEARIAAEATVLHGRCLPFGETLGYGALAMALREAAGIGDDDPADLARRKLSDLAAGVMETAEAPEIARQLALLAGLDRPSDREAGLPDQRILHVSARHFLEALARRRPLCLILDDLHLADAALFDLVESVASRAREVALCVYVQARPELLQRRTGWGGGLRGATSVSLEPLDEGSRRTLVETLLREHPGALHLAENVVRAAGGNPLFTEELVATAAERGTLDAAPTALRALIAARLDGLPVRERETIRMASVMGESFWEGGLRALGVGEDARVLLEALAERDLVRAGERSLIPAQRQYAFKHALIRDEAYATLPRSERRALHGRLADWIAEAGKERSSELAGMLAHHALEAGQDDRALRALQEAADVARRAAARAEEAALLQRAVGIAERAGAREVLRRLHTQRGAALAALGAWKDARVALEAALSHAGPGEDEARAEVLGQLAITSFWLLDSARARSSAAESLAIADRLGLSELAATALGALGVADSADGRLDDAIGNYGKAIERAGARVGAACTLARQFRSQSLYWRGRLKEATEEARAAVAMSRATHDATNILLSLQQQALALAGRGHYGEAVRTFDEARRFGREHGIGTLTARLIAMSAGWRLDVWDFAGAEALAGEARDLAKSLDFAPPAVSAGLNLLFNFTRRGDVGRAEALLGEVAESVTRAGGWHGWLWRLRLAALRAELALTRGDREAAAGFAEETIAQGRKAYRPKYEAIGLRTRAAARVLAGSVREAVADLSEACRLAREVGDPTLFLGVASPLLALEGSDALAAEARATARAISAALPEPGVRTRFESADWVARVLRA